MSSFHALGYGARAWRQAVLIWTLLTLLPGLGSALRAQSSLNTTLLGNLPYPAELSDIWGWHNPVDGREYALVGVFDGFSIADVTDPTNPVALHFVPGAGSIWRDVKTWGHYAYVTNESAGGLLIVDLSGLPGSINTWNWTGGGLDYSTAHNIFMDENGIAYLCGSNGSLGTLFLDVDANPTNPPVVGSYTTRYVHDLYVRGDTMWTAEINNGIFSVVDISDKTSPVVLATQGTTSDFSHNIWVSDDARWLVTTDEVSGAFIDAYDVSDLSDIRRLDTWQSNPGSGVIPHNVFILGNYLLTSYYRDGLTVTDATFPDNMIQTGWYDTSPLSGTGFNGAWGTYPYLPSGKVLVSDIEGGLFVLDVQYTQAAYLRGQVSDALSGIPLSGVTVELIDAPDLPSTSTNVLGQYASGSHSPGTYTLRASRFGYATREISGVNLSSGLETILDFSLDPLPSFTLEVSVVDSLSGLPLPFAPFALETADTLFAFVANGEGRLSIPGFLSGLYTAYAGQWGYQTRSWALDLQASEPELLLQLNRGWYDDFLFDLGWTTSGTASAGRWERDIPIGTFQGPLVINPGWDAPDDLGEACYVTGNGGGSAGFDDVDNGSTLLRSPLFDLSAYGDPHLRYARWWRNGGGSSVPNDSLIIRLSNGSETATLETASVSDPTMGMWVQRDIRVLDFLEPGTSMQFSAYTADDVAQGHLVEAGLDHWWVYDAAATTPPVPAIHLPEEPLCGDAVLLFSDNSAGFPLAWSWSFPGGIPDVAFGPIAEVRYPDAGTYDVTLTVYNDLGSASLTLEAAVSIPEPLVTSLDSSPSTNGFDGTASVVLVTGGSPPYTYLWNDPLGQNTKTATGLSPGWYRVQVSDSRGCERLDSVLVSGVVSGLDPGPAQAAGLSIAPNPFAHTTVLQRESSEDWTWEVRNAQGQQVRKGVWSPGNSGGKLELGSAWPSGVYAFRAMDRRGLAISVMLVKE
jgi:choice-of-anchor B domain-containing protein